THEPPSLHLLLLFSVLVANHGGVTVTSLTTAPGSGPPPGVARPTREIQLRGPNACSDPTRTDVPGQGPIRTDVCPERLIVLPCVKAPETASQPPRPAWRPDHDRPDRPPAPGARVHR